MSPGSRQTHPCIQLCHREHCILGEHYSLPPFPTSPRKGILCPASLPSLLCKALQKITQVVLHTEMDLGHFRSQGHFHTGTGERFVFSACPLCSLLLPVAVLTGVGGSVSAAQAKIQQVSSAFLTPQSWLSLRQ